MPPDTNGDLPALVILGPGHWAERVSARLAGVLFGTRMLSCAEPTALPALLAGDDVAAVVARLAANTLAAPLAAIPKQTHVPLVVCARADVHTDAVLEVMGAGAAALVRDGDTSALSAAIQRACTPGTTQRTATAPAGSDAALTALADRLEQPLALVIDGNIRHLNRAMRKLFRLAVDVDLAGRPLVALAAPDAAKALSTLLRRALLLDLDDKTREVLRFVPADGPAFAAQVTAAPITIGARAGLAVQLDPTGVQAGIGPQMDTETLPERTDERPALLQRLGVLTDDASAVERTSALALAMVADYPAQRRRLGFAGAGRLVHALADCLAAAAPAQSTLYLMADDIYAVLVEDVSTAELDRLRRRLADAPREAANPALRDLGLRVGVTRVAPGAGAAPELLDRALADAMPAAVEMPASTETTEGLDLLEAGCSVDTRPPPSIAGTPAADGVTSAPLSVTPERNSVETVLMDGLMERVERALEGEGFTLALQPIVSLMGDSREHYSVLVRLRQPGGGLISAARIIRSAAGTGQMADIDRWVIRSALRLLNQRRRGGDMAAFFIGDAVGHVPGGHAAPGVLAVALLVVEVDVRVEGFQKRRLRTGRRGTAPRRCGCPNRAGADHPLVGGRAAGGDERGAQRRILRRNSA
jgi:hypothetical protein